MSDMIDVRDNQISQFLNILFILPNVFEIIQRKMVEN